MESRKREGERAPKKMLPKMLPRAPKMLPRALKMPEATANFLYFPRVSRAWR